MSGYYHRCSNGIGKPVEIKMNDGRIHRGIIERVSNDRVYLRPMNKNYGGYGYASGYRRGGCGRGGCSRGGWGWGFGAGIALGAIAALVFLPLFFW